MQEAFVPGGIFSRMHFFPKDFFIGGFLSKSIIYKMESLSSNILN